MRVKNDVAFDGVHCVICGAVISKRRKETAPNPRVITCSKQCSVEHCRRHAKEFYRRKAKARRAEYEANPKLCEVCGIVIPYERGVLPNVRKCADCAAPSHHKKKDNNKK